MFVFGCPISSEEMFSRRAGPSIAAMAEPDSKVMELRGYNSIFVAYNDVLAAAREEPELEGVVLMHQDVEIVDSKPLDKLRRQFEDPDVWIVGVIGGRGVRAPVWWGAEKWEGAVVENPYPEFADEVPTEARKLIQGKKPRFPAEVDMLDGLFLALSPRAARELLFDERLGPSFHCYDSDICLQARARGGKVTVCDIDLVHHSSGGLSGHQAEYAVSHQAVARKWGL